MRALYEIQHAEPSARAFETFIAVTGVGAERETDRSSALAATPCDRDKQARTYTRAPGSAFCISYEARTVVVR